MGLVDRESSPEHFATGPDPDRHLQVAARLYDAGADELYIQQISTDLDGLFTAYE